MILFKKTADLHRWLDQQKASGKAIGFVPTMGALHEGHISLINISKTTCPFTVCSIFVNPTQFNDPKDFQKYPITLEKDIILLEKAGTDVLFLPEVAEMYPDGTNNLEKYDLGRLETILEGKFRPGHFQGVCQVMRRLLQLVQPDDLFMGSKDYQQCMVVQRLIQLMSWPIHLHRCPIVREPDGLAMSSRNLRLSPDERQRATAIYRALKDLPNAQKILTDAQFKIDYIETADAETLEPSPPKKGAVALIAAFQGEIRLIDNMILA
ncbi:MAG: pantoate--beta-alanine ligase [Bacteroidetes bacterium]|nr:pantoate--beta-alanine ligase [Bacteroidota bacterium]